MAKSARTQGRLQNARRWLTAIEGPELVIGLVGAIGTDLGLVCDVLQEELENVKYTSSVVRLRDRLRMGISLGAYS